MTPSEELDKMVNELDKKGCDERSPILAYSSSSFTPPPQISVSLKEWSDLHRRNGYLEGVMASVAGTDGECWIKDPWTYYQRVMLGMPVVVEKDP